MTTKPKPTDKQIIKYLIWIAWFLIGIVVGISMTFGFFTALTGEIVEKAHIEEVNIDFNETEMVDYLLERMPDYIEDVRKNDK